MVKCFHSFYTQGGSLVSIVCTWANHTIYHIVNKLLSSSIPLTFTSQPISGPAGIVQLVWPWPYRFWGRKKLMLLEFQSMRAHSPLAFIRNLLWTFCSSIQSCDKRRGFLRPFRCEISSWNVGGANLRAIQCCMLGRLRIMATFKNEARSNHLANPHHISVSVVSGRLVSIAFSDFTSSNYR